MEVLRLKWTDPPYSYYKVHSEFHKECICILGAQPQHYLQRTRAFFHRLASIEPSGYRVVFSYTKNGGTDFGRSAVSFYKAFLNLSFSAAVSALTVFHPPDKDCLKHHSYERLYKEQLRKERKREIKAK